MKNKKYSLADRLKYYSNISLKEAKKSPDKLTSRERYSAGYIQAVERGRPLNFDKMDKSYKRGIISGEKAKKRSLNIKF